MSYISIHPLFSHQTRLMERLNVRGVPFHRFNRQVKVLLIGFVLNTMSNNDGQLPP